MQSEMFPETIYEGTAYCSKIFPHRKHDYHVITYKSIIAILKVYSCPGTELGDRVIHKRCIKNHRHAVHYWQTMDQKFPVIYFCEGSN